MRVVSLVPSLTETLLEAGANVVGRTRYCVHPRPRVSDLPVVGGTKDLDFDRLAALRPDLLVLDREENLPWMKAKAPCAVHVFHATGVEAMAEETRRLAEAVGGAPALKLREQAVRWDRVRGRPPLTWSWDLIPGEMRRSGPRRPWNRLLYLIWKKPWMSVSTETFIGSVFERLGASEFWPEFPVKYPEIELADFDPETTLLLLSSEPFPFAKKWDELEALPHTRVLVDGEPFSWFGVRSLEFMESARGPG